MHVYAQACLQSCLSVRGVEEASKHTTFEEAIRHTSNQHSQDTSKQHSKKQSITQTTNISKKQAITQATNIRKKQHTTCANPSELNKQYSQPTSEESSKHTSTMCNLGEAVYPKLLRNRSVTKQMQAKLLVTRSHQWSDTIPSIEIPIRPISLNHLLTSSSIVPRKGLLFHRPA